MIRMIRIFCNLFFRGKAPALYLLTAILGFPLSVFSQWGITDSLKTDSGPEQYYCLFHPPHPTKDPGRPLLILADPGGRARYAVTRYKDLAEKHNFILCCSYAVKNGPYEPNKDLLTHLLLSLLKNESLSAGSHFMAGFSARSRLASAYCIENRKIKGIIACGAGFPPEFGGQALSIPEYTGIIRIYDMNFSEMVRNRMKYLDAEWKDKLLVGEFDHSWPPAEVFELGLFYAGLTSGEYTEDISGFEDKMIQDQIRRSLKIAALLNNLNRETEENREKEYPGGQSGLISVEECKAYIEHEYSKLNEYIGNINAIHTNIPALKNNLLPRSYWVYLRKDLDRSAEMAQSPSDSARFVRYKSFLIANVYEIAAAKIRYDQDYPAAGKYLKVWSALSPDNPFPHYMLARNYMRMGKNGKAKKELKKALKKDSQKQLPDPAADSLLKSLY